MSTVKGRRSQAVSQLHGCLKVAHMLLTFDHRSTTDK